VATTYVSYGSRSPTRRSSLRNCLCLLYYVLLVILLDKQLLHRKQLLLLSKGLGLVGNSLYSLAMALDLYLVGLEEMLVKLLMLLLVLVVIGKALILSLLLSLHLSLMFLVLLLVLALLLLLLQPNILPLLWMTCDWCWLSNNKLSIRNRTKGSYWLSIIYKIMRCFHSLNHIA
jgi:hypothetical protein